MINDIIQFPSMHSALYYVESYLLLLKQMLSCYCLLSMYASEHPLTIYLLSLYRHYRLGHMHLHNPYNDNNAKIMQNMFCY